MRETLKPEIKITEQSNVSMSKANESTIGLQPSYCEKQTAPYEWECSSKTANLTEPDPQFKEGPEYKGKLLLREISVLDKQGTPRCYVAEWAILARTILYLALQIPHLDVFAKYTAVDIFILLLLMYLGITLHYFNLKFVVIGLTDFRRKLFYQKVMSMLISQQRKTKLRVRKLPPEYLIPSIDITN